MDNHLIEISQARHLGEYRLRLTFSDGVIKDVDLAGELWGPVFEPLLEPGLFAQVRVDPEIGTITWPNGADMAADTLYAKGKTVAKETA